MEGFAMAVRIKDLLRFGGKALGAAVALVLASLPALAAETPVAVFPETSYDAYLIYESLAVFWVAIIGLVVIIRMKLKEIERTQALGADREDQDAPLLQ